jgi:signal transduction histidine kinase
MLANLLDNAIKHLPAGTTISIRLLADAGFGRLEMEDDGPGFPPDVVDRPFEKYVKGKNSSGSGLGLAFAEAVVRAHGGQIRATNGPRGGALIVIDLALSSPVPDLEPSRVPAKMPMARN